VFLQNRITYFGLNPRKRRRRMRMKKVRMKKVSWKQWRRSRRGWLSVVPSAGISTPRIFFHRLTQIKSRYR